MSKLIQALLTGIFITFILDFFIFLGIKLNYIDFYEIDIYYNILFADHQNIYIFTLSSIILGLMSTYLQNKKIVFIIISLLAILSLSTLIQDIGNSLGKSMLMSKNHTLKSQKHIYMGDIYYDGRDTITFYDYELKKMITLQKKDLIK